MAMTRGRPHDDVSSAPESGTVRDETSGNEPAHPQERGAPRNDKLNPQCGATDKQNRDDPGFAGEER
jgi:hypothetical protein